MRFVDISKMQRRQSCLACVAAGNQSPDNGSSNTDENGNPTCWHYVGATSNSSSTSSGCDSRSSSKENYYVPYQQQRPYFLNSGLTLQQQQQIQYYYCLQQEQLKLLQQQLLHRRRLQNQLRDEGLNLNSTHKNTKNTPGLTCNQQYLMQQQIDLQNKDNAKNNMNNNCYLTHSMEQNNEFLDLKMGQGSHFRRGMTDISTISEIENISNINRHIEHQFSRNLPQSSPTFHQPYAKSNLESLSTKNSPLSQQQHNSALNQQSLRKQGKLNNDNTASFHSGLASASGLGLASHSPQHHRLPLNSPKNSLFSFAHVTANKRYQQQQLNDRLLQQQHLQLCQQQQIHQHSNKGNENTADVFVELSEESLKQNVAIVLSNLDRYNRALRSVILNEKVSNISSRDSLFLNEDNKIEDEVDNNNFLKYIPHQDSAMAATNIASVLTPDYNSNATTPGARNNDLVQQQQTQHGVGGMLCGGGVTGNGGSGGNNLNCSLASSQDFTHDNSDYQWFLDYGYRDGCGGMQRSVLSSLSASYNAMGDLIYYEDLKNLDANLAEVDMESFRAEDIHSLLSQLPAYCKSQGSTNSQMQHSLLLQQQQQQRQQMHLQLQQANMMSYMQHMAENMSQTSTTSTNELIDNSFCKSELLFSPVKESHISVDSLDMDAYPDEGDIILTCNKDNYTIAFEGSVLYSDESFYEPCDTAVQNKQNCINLHSNLEDIVRRNKTLEVSMTRSAQSFNAPGQSPLAQPKAKLERYPSGNNNNDSGETIILTRHLPHCNVRKSSSLPNLQGEVLLTEIHEEQQKVKLDSDNSGPLNVSQAISTSTMESCASRARNLLPMCQMPISITASVSERLQHTDNQYKDGTPTPQPHQQHHFSQQHRHRHRGSCASSCIQGCQNFDSTASHGHISGSASSGNSNPAAFNLVKLFIKQKSSNSNSCAQEDAQACALTCMDVSSGCWPSSDAAISSCSSSLEKRLHKKSMQDSGKGSAVSRHDEEGTYEGASAASTPKKQLRTRCDAVFYDDGASSSSTGSLTATNSPAHRRRSMPLRNPQLYQLAAGTQTQTHCSQLSSDASNSEQVTEIPCGSKTRRRNSSRQPMSCASSSEMITRSMQTSCGSFSTTHSSLSDRYRCVPPSFLAKLHNLGEQREAPIYVIYPNYALPDLGFVKTSSNADVIFSPFNYKMTLDSAGADTSFISLKKQRSNQGVTDNELLKTLNFKHISDWHSLMTLLPVEYRRRLQHIPEVRQLSSQLDAELTHRPLFCMSPPIRRNRPNVCDCSKNLQQLSAQTQLEEATSSGSSQPPSSGYRGSSTLLTDSEVDIDPLKQMYVYQYDQQQRVESAMEASPSSRNLHTSGPAQPQPMPRSILRKTNSAQLRTKRSSMIEGKQTHQMSKIEKRRSLQEPPHNFTLASADELAEVFEEEQPSRVQPPKQRLSRKDLDARARAENFLASLPRSELKYYAEIAAILESSGEQVQYDAAALKKEVSRVLSQHKKVSFNDLSPATDLQQLQTKRFLTPPNSPNISIAGPHQRETLEVQEQRKLEGNRFKRLQIQWELMSKDSSMLKELASEQATKSGGSTPTSSNSGNANSSQRSRIPRPVSYPAGRCLKTNASESQNTCVSHKMSTKSHNSPDNISSPKICRVGNTHDAANSGKCSTRSPSRIVQPKRYSLLATPTSMISTAGRARTPTARSSGAVTPNTPKRQSVTQSPRPASRVR